MTLTCMPPSVRKRTRRASRLFGRNKEITAESPKRLLMSAMAIGVQNHVHNTEMWTDNVKFTWYMVRCSLSSRKYMVCAIEFHSDR
ncbi:hypothetical protein DPMN_137344 [Dreissena polymorpha]|uniref:Uncharacterized protein n=1 Tax=Dreissena polymorpha TaxID=45954 RepID=A0A9D4G7M6_DREPO|nr:hypothetical protein DPMN_137344 [Dreissena polymorpha]